MHGSKIDNGFTVTYNLKKEGNGVYAFIIRTAKTLMGKN
jgi:hypothetical protein